MPPGDGDGLIDESGGEDDGKMGAAVEADPDLVVGDGDIGRHVDEIAKDLACLGVIIAAHASRHQAVEAGGDDEQGHVEVDLEADRRRQCVDVEEVHGIGKRILDQHTLGVASNDIAGGGGCIVGEQDRGLIVTKILDEELTEGALAGTSLLFVDPRGAVFAM